MSAVCGRVETHPYNIDRGYASEYHYPRVRDGKGLARGTRAEAQRSPAQPGPRYEGHAQLLRYQFISVL
jgi:hypothetical protein